MYWCNNTSVRYWLLWLLPDVLILILLFSEGGFLPLLSFSLSFNRHGWLSMLNTCFVVQRLPITVLEVSKKLLTESSRNPVAAIVEKEAGWYLLSSILASMPREVCVYLFCIFKFIDPLINCMRPIIIGYSWIMQEIEDQVFDILSLWADLFSGNPEHETKQSGDLTSRIR